MSEAGEILQTVLVGVSSDGHDMFTTMQGPGEEAQLDPKGTLTDTAWYTLDLQRCMYYHVMISSI